MKLIAKFILKQHIWITPSVSGLSHTLNRKPKALIFLDLDGTLWRDTGAGGILKKNHFSNYIYNPNKSDKKLVIFTNQTLFSRETSINTKVLFDYFISWLKVIRKLRPVAILVCHHHPQANLGDLRLDCPFRKPSGKMITKLNKIIPVDSSQSFLVGDKITDMIAGMRSSIHTNFLIYNQNMFEINESSNNHGDDFAIFRVIENNQADNFFEQLSFNV